LPLDKQWTFKCTPGTFQTAIYCGIIKKLYM